MPSAATTRPRKGKKKQHPVSAAQRRWAFAAEERGELPAGKALEWARRTKGQSLPEKTGKSMDAIDELDLLVKGSFPPKPKANGGDEDDDDPGPGDDDAPGDTDDGDEDFPDGADDGDESADGDADGIPDDQETDNAPDGELPPEEDEGAPGDDDPASLAELDADADGDIDPDDAAALGDAGGESVDALAPQLIDAERNYYAAVGHKGHANHNTVRLLDVFHKLLRKFVRAATSGQTVDDAEPPAEDGDPDGDGFPSEEDDGDQPDDGTAPAQSGVPAQPGFPPKKSKAQRAMEKAYRAFGAKHGLGVLVGVEPYAEDLRKGTYDFRDTENMALVPEQFFMAYLVAFIEAAYVECCQGTDVENSPDKSAARIMLKLVTLIPKATNLARVATKYNVTEKSIAKILRDKGIITVAQAAADQYASNGMPTDADSFSAAGAGNLVRSQAPAWAQVLPESADLHPGGSRLQLVDRARPVQVIDDRGAPMRVAGLAAHFGGRNELAKATVHSLCRIHSPVDMRKTDTLTHAFAKCTCPG